MLPVNLVISILLYWVICSGFYLVAAFVFTRIMKALARIQKGWTRSVLWLLMVTPVRGAVVLLPFFIGLDSVRSKPEPEKLSLLIFVILCFAASLVPAWIYLRKYFRDWPEIPR
jgi:hypothetical protein